MIRKISISSAGGYDRLQQVEAEEVAPREDEVQIRVAYSGVNYADCLVRWGVYESAKKYVGWPITPGFEVSGTVTAVGAKTAGFKVGDQVVGIMRFGGYSSQVCIPAHQVIHLPKNFSLAEGAAFPSVFMTAYYSLLQIFNLPPGARILVHSAAGGVGSALIQVAKANSISVVGVVGSSNKLTYVQELGAEAVFDKSSPDFRWEQIRERFPKGFDAVYDANGPETLKISYDLLRPTGKLVTYGSHNLLPKSGGKMNYLKAAWGLLKMPRFNPMDMVTDNKSLICFNVSFLFEEARLVRENFEGLVKLIESGAIRPPRVEIHDFEKVAQAHQRIESGKTVGKLVLKHS